jgi:EAL domain-containing protein (putative c-di-GMP-specific phosphodiesterase class I)
MKTILTLAANPRNTTPLSLAEEVRDIEEALKRSENRSQFVLATRWAVRPRDLVRAMTELKPNIVHFCGHGNTEEGILLEDNQGNIQLVNTDGLANLFKSFTAQVECVLLNACYSKFQSEAISQYIDYVIGMEQEIKDRDAIEFAVSFYDALGAGQTYEHAYGLGCVAMQLVGSPENLVPSFKKKNNNIFVFNNEKSAINLLNEETSFINIGMSFKPLPSILEKYDSFIEDFIEKIDLNSSLELSITNVTKNLFNAKLVYVYKYENDTICSDIKYNNLSSNISANNLNLILKNRYLKLLKSDRPHKIYLYKDSLFLEEGYVIIIPNKILKSVIIIFGSSIELDSMEDIIGIMIGGLYTLEKDLNRLKTKEDIKYRMYDLLKQQYRYVSDKAYDSRFQDFRKSLTKIQVFFEPIIFFDKYEENVTIAGWEALARDPETGRAPALLFEVAEMWGVRFQTELDLYILETALKAYKEATEKSGTQRYDEKKMLSVNVYPSSIIRTNYEILLGKLIRDQKLISGKKLTLEISEKTLLPAIIDDEQKGLESFRSIARKYRRNYDVKFAIDDFGVGNASVSRLAEIDTTYVKLDRNILHYDKKLGASIIEYLVNLKYDLNYFTILEGFDEFSNFSLSELVVELGVEYIQGHSLGIATPEIKRRLEKPEYEKIFEILKWRRTSST